jgi:hypothetical protein
LCTATSGRLWTRSPRGHRPLAQLLAGAYLWYVILDGALIRIDRVADDRPSYSGKHERHAIVVSWRRWLGHPRTDIVAAGGGVPPERREALPGDLAAKTICDLSPRPFILRRVMMAMYGLGTR